MTAAAPLTVCGAEVFSAGESFSDGTGSIPAILTDMVLPGGEIGTEYQVQLWSIWEFMQRDSSHKIDYFFIMQEQIHFIFLIFRRADILTILMHRVSIRIQMKKCNPEIVLPWTLLIRRISLPEIMVTVKTSPVTGKPAVKSAKVSRQGTKRNVTVTFTVPKSCDGTDWVLPINLLYSNLVWIWR